MVGGPSGQNVNKSFRFLRIVFDIKTLVISIFPGVAQGPFLPTRSTILQTLKRCFQPYVYIGSWNVYSDLRLVRLWSPWYTYDSVLFMGLVHLKLVIYAKNTRKKQYRQIVRKITWIICYSVCRKAMTYVSPTKVLSTPHRRRTVQSTHTPYENVCKWRYK